MFRIPLQEPGRRTAIMATSTPHLGPMIVCVAQGVKHETTLAVVDTTGKTEVLKSHRRYKSCWPRVFHRLDCVCLLPSPPLV
jgi:hypothetical protein